MQHISVIPQDKGSGRGIILAVALALAVPTQAIAACGLALAMAIDISGSIDRNEYRIQMKGLADALRDATVAEALVRENAAISVIQWTGLSRQAVTIPWLVISEFGQLDVIADALERNVRPWRNYSTAIGSALAFTMDTFDAAPVCARKVIDVSGDGRSNEGEAPSDMHARLTLAGFVVNGLVIEGPDDDLTSYYWENVIVGPGAFVMTANSFEQYGERMKLKLLREVTQALSMLQAPAQR